MAESYARGPGHRERTRGPVLAAYAETGALEFACTAEAGCGVAVDEFCVHLDGTLRKIPCPNRPNRIPHNPDNGGDG